MTNEELAALASIEAKMTAGEWSHEHSEVFGDAFVHCTDSESICCCGVEEQDRANATGIAASRNAFRDLIAQAKEANELRDETERLKAELAEAKPYKDQHDRAARQMRMGL